MVCFGEGMMVGKRSVDTLFGWVNFIWDGLMISNLDWFLAMFFV